MWTTRGVRVALSIAVLGITGLSSGVVTMTSAGAATTPKVVVTPAKNLRNGEAVKVTGTGFTPGDTVFVVECLVSAKGEAGCNLPASGIPKALTVSATGALPVSHFRVTTGKVGTGKCGTTKANVGMCAVSVGNASGGDSAVGHIIFKAPAKK